MNSTIRRVTTFGEFVGASFTNGVATLDEKTGYLLSNVYASPRPSGEGTQYDIASFHRVNGGGYRIQGVNSFTAQVQLYVVWVAH